MWHRLTRLLKTSLSIAAFSKNPFKYILSALFVALVPYLLYLFLGGLLFFLLLATGIFLLYRYFQTQSSNGWGD